MDYVQRKLTIELVIMLGYTAGENEPCRYRPARVTVTEVAFVILPSPDTTNPSWMKPGSIQIDTYEGVPEGFSDEVPEAPKGTQITSVFLNEMNQHLIFAAGEAVLEWTGKESTDIP